MAEYSELISFLSENQIINSNAKYYPEMNSIIMNNEYISVNITSPEHAHHIGLAYELIKNYDQMKKYYEIAVDMNHVGTMNILGIYYEKMENNDELALKYYNMAKKHNDVNACHNLGLFYQRRDNEELMLENYNHAILLGYKSSYTNIGAFYLTKGNYQLAETYFLKSIEGDSDNGINYLNLGIFYENIKVNVQLMKKYYLRAIELGNNLAICNYASYLLKHELNIYESLKYFKMAYDRGNNECLLIINMILTNDFNIQFAKENMSLLNDSNLQTYYNYLSNYCEIINSNIIINKQECPICYENTHILEFQCDHFVCYKCYNKIKKNNKCPICRSNIY